ncbi:hypothetical protein G5B30_03945 [Sphingobacterium sp. SGG-5]|uniref:hypothetical protein n=1 Tax=Sphingobacterium sp. SGG-5 TaxID=2710881 RepID=UPI0013ED85DB|nr:hypothetical protein [Sphingobacterium sp. SGG-5]NGM61066.1 hypothetical protein [Sphingobacterium sp. SGG-5]
MLVTLEINSDSASSILDVLKRIKGVKVTSVDAEGQSEAGSPDTIAVGLRQAVSDVKLARAGKKKLKTFDELLGEL